MLQQAPKRCVSEARAPRRSQQRKKRTRQDHHKSDASGVRRAVRNLSLSSCVNDARARPDARADGGPRPPHGLREVAARASRGRAAA
jgi:hypothetical protein